MILQLNHLQRERAAASAQEDFLYAIFDRMYRQKA
jgi:hypothetical protein